MDALTFPIRSDKLAMQVQVTAHIEHVKSAFQTIDVIETETMGRVLLLDGHVQLSTFDEFAYHELLVGIPLLNLTAPKAALVVGGGDGGVLREFCRDPRLETIEMVEIDEAVITVSKRSLPSLSDGAFDDPRAKVLIQDAFEYVKTQESKYDIIVIDSTDTYEEETGEISEALFTERFYRDCLAALTPGGIVVTQADNQVFCPYSLEAVEAEFRKVFPVVGSYAGIVPSFGGFSAFCYGSKGATLAPVWPANSPRSGFRYLTPESYALAFNFPKF